MPTLLRKTAQGKVEALKQGQSNFTVLSDQIIPIAGMNMRVAHLIQYNDPSGPVAWWLFNRLTMLLQISRTEGGLFHRKGETGQQRVRVFHEGFHALRADPITSGYIKHFGPTGYLYGGSNVHSGGQLCLGESFSPFNLSPVDLFCNGVPNQDLQWVGEAIPATLLKDKWKSQSNKTYPTYQITSWPPVFNRSPIAMPPEVLGYFGQ